MGEDICNDWSVKGLIPKLYKKFTQLNIRNKLLVVQLSHIWLLDQNVTWCILVFLLQMLLLFIHHILRFLFHYTLNHNNSNYFVPTIIDYIYNSFYHVNYIIIFPQLTFWGTEIFRYKKWISTLLADSSIILDWLRLISSCASCKQISDHTMMADIQLGCM